MSWGSNIGTLDGQLSLCERSGQTTGRRRQIVYSWLRREALSPRVGQSTRLGTPLILWNWSRARLQWQVLDRRLVLNGSPRVEMRHQGTVACGSEEWPTQRGCNTNTNPTKHAIGSDEQQLHPLDLSNASMSQSIRRPKERSKKSTKQRTVRPLSLIIARLITTRFPSQTSCDYTPMTEGCRHLGGISLGYTASYRGRCKTYLICVGTRIVVGESPRALILDLVRG
ncbi:hypothetical protein P153DRAFT_355903 [Dothidotthia symphoricarpi CBS 119687]|uniref:Uncharacterized protein n=1 Tax=Dothidotthia symphoricarpi CBS 119687 TaxID=1392245 RepID=A0A6A6AL06_9PLEO|nr:uncharacterized protein P153DRAFT_355903 [Dothidotthia symphoricarpi CBS 119687]KAF2131131.1 hypothetical protein P153DRAFT_355903 [Dothidotthia symphoricarpi CBS 119687]